MTVRRLKFDELEKLILLYEHLHEEDEGIDRQTLILAWRKIQTCDAFTYFVIKQNNLLVSSCNLTVIPNLTRGGKSIGLIENVVTHRDYRKKGLGRQIIEAALKHAMLNNCYKVMLLSSTTRTDAHGFYSKLGFSSEDKVGFSIRL